MTVFELVIIACTMLGGMDAYSFSKHCIVDVDSYYETEDMCRATGKVRVGGIRHSFHGARTYEAFECRTIVINTHSGGGGPGRPQ